MGPLGAAGLQCRELRKEVIGRACPPQAGKPILQSIHRSGSGLTTVLLRGARELQRATNRRSPDHLAMQRQLKIVSASARVAPDCTDRRL
jgi:hypothetical protein